MPPIRPGAASVSASALPTVILLIGGLAGVIRDFIVDM